MDAGGPDLRAARVVQNRGLFSCGRRGGNAPSPQLPKAVSPAVLPSGTSGSDICVPSRLFVLFCFIVVDAFSEFPPLLHVGPQGLEKHLEPIGGQCLRDELEKAFSTGVCPAWCSGRGGHPGGRSVGPWISLCLGRALRRSCEGLQVHACRPVCVNPSAHWPCEPAQ